MLLRLQEAGNEVEALVCASGRWALRGWLLGDSEVVAGFVWEARGGFDDAGGGSVRISVRFLYRPIGLRCCVMRWASLG